MATAPENEVSPEADDRQAKPPFLRRVQIRGYKSIAFCDVTLAPLTILVGRNASGKSNFLDALAFLRDLMEMPVSNAVTDRNGWQSIYCRTSSTPLVEMKVEATFASFNSMWDADYAFSLEVAGVNRIRVKQEVLSLSQHGCSRSCGYRVNDENVEWFGIEHFADDSDWTSKVAPQQKSDDDDKLDDPRIFRRRRYDRVLLSIVGTQPFVDLAEGLRGSSVYSFHPPAIRVRRPSSGSLILERDGSNLASTIEVLGEMESETIQRIEQYLKAIVPGIGGFRIAKDNGHLAVYFQVETNRGPTRSLEFDASNMSDGTLRILASLVAAFQIGSPVASSGFIGIEEPETALHPAAMRALVDALDEATLRTQILLTTHSAEMLDNPTIQPENIRVVQMIDGETVIGPVDEASVEIVRRELNTLGGLERENQLEPDLGDLERQRNLAKARQE